MGDNMVTNSATLTRTVKKLVEADIKKLLVTYVNQQDCEWNVHCHALPVVPASQTAVAR